MNIEDIRKLIKEYNDNKKELDNVRYILNENTQSVTFPKSNNQFSRRIWLNNGFRKYQQKAIDDYIEELRLRNKQIEKELGAK